MTGDVPDTRTAGLLGPVAFSAGIALLLAAPLMRGGNRYAALIALEILGLLVLAAIGARRALAQPPVAMPIARPLWALLLSPLFLALIQLTPLPIALWSALPGHDIYAHALGQVGVQPAGWRPLSLNPDATLASLLAAIPIIAAFLLGHLTTLTQLRALLRVVAALALAEVMLGLLQISGGERSPLFFGVMTYGPPIGTFANRNHFANYLAMALAGYVWLAFESIRYARLKSGGLTFGSRHRTALWAVGGLVLVLGILMSRSRGAAVFGLPMALAGVALVSLCIKGWSRGSWVAVGAAALLVGGAAALVGFDAVTSRVSGEQLASSANFRGELARTSLQGAMTFFPWGSGWGSYDSVYPRFQPGSIAGFANHAHEDYVEMLFEGGIFFVLLAGLFAWLAVGRARSLIAFAREERKLDRECMAAALCGLGLLGLLAHSLVEFNLRIPANAILGALLAGAYLRPHCGADVSHDRPSQSHSSRH
ncbi:MAG: O-antigen ligase family protein [Ramlibacter sp.]